MKSIINPDNLPLLLAFQLPLFLEDLFVSHLLLLLMTKLLYCVCLWEGIVGVIIKIDGMLFGRRGLLGLGGGLNLEGFFSDFLASFINEDTIYSD